MGCRQSFPIVELSKDRIVMVTGANSGIGYEIAKWCAMMGATVILACRSEERTREAMDKMQKEFKLEKEKGTTGLSDSSELALEFMKLDLALFQSVTEFCDEFKKSGRQLHALVCNAGLGFCPLKRSEDGLEMMLQVNYLSHFIIIAKFLSIMKQSGPDCRILLMSSKAHEVGNFDVDTMNYTGTAEKFPSLDYYGRSKLYQIMQTFAMARHLEGSNITINCMHPGVVETELWREMDSCIVKCLIGLSRKFGTLRTSLEGATTAIDLATNPKRTGVSGHYWIDCKIVRSTKTSRSKQKQGALWEATLPFVEKYLTETEISELKWK